MSYRSKVVQRRYVALPDTVSGSNGTSSHIFAGHDHHNARAVLIGGFHGLVQRRFNAQFPFGGVHCFDSAFVV